MDIADCEACDPASPLTERTLRKVLSAYAERDSAPRVQSHVGYIHSGAAELTRTEAAGQ
jgi:hypothetical protein